LKAPNRPASNAYLSARLKKLARYGATIGLLFGLAYFAPASWFGLYLEHLSDNKLSLTQASGTIWDGSAQLLLRAHPRKSTSSTTFSSELASGLSTELQSSPEPGLLIGSPFKWHIWLAALPAPSVNVSIENECCLPAPLSLSLSLNLTLSTSLPQDSEVPSQGASQHSTSRGGLILKLADSQSNWPAQWLSGLGAPWNTVAPRGALVVQTEQFKFIFHPISGEAPVLQGVAKLTLKDLSSQLSTLEPLGTYVIKLTGIDSGIKRDTPLSPADSLVPGAVGVQGSNDSVTLHLSLFTTEGRLELKGEGDWVNQQLHFTGTAKAMEGFEAALANLLSILGTRRDNTATLKIG